MADKLNLDIEVGGVEQSINSIKDLKNAIKDARNEQVKAGEQFGISSKQYEEASKRVSQLKDKVEDLGDSTRSLQGSGIERASQGFSQLGDGLRNLDFDKVKVGLTAIKSALAATGIMLIVQGVMYLIENFDELSKGSGLLAKALRFVGDIVTVVTDYIYKFTDAIGLTNSALDKMGEATVENANKAKDALASQTAEYDRQIAIAKASGKNAIDLEIAKQQAIIDTNKALVEQTIAYVRSGGELSDEQKKLLTEQLNAIKNAVNAQQVITLTADKETKDKLVQQRKDHKAEIDRINAEEADAFFKRITDELEAERKAAEDLRKIKEDARAKDKEAELTNQEIDNAEALAKAQLKVLKDQEDIDAQIALLTVKRDIELQNEMLTTDQKKVIQQQYENDVLKIKEDSVAKEKALEKQKQTAVFDIAKASTDSLQSLSNLYFTVKRANLKKGSKEDLEQAKKQFNINKALAITSATISGIQGVVNALSAQSVVPEPFGTVLKVATAVGVGLAAAANIAKISSSKFDESGGGGGGGASAVTSVPVPAPPTISNPDANVSGTKFDESGKKIEDTKQQPIQVNVKAQVVESEMTQSQQNVSSIKDKSTF